MWETRDKIIEFHIEATVLGIGNLNASIAHLKRAEEITAPAEGETSSLVHKEIFRAMANLYAFMLTVKTRP